MQKKYLLRMLLVIVLMGGSFLILKSATASKATEKSTCKSESMNECQKKRQKTSTSGEMLWEGISRQFISSIGISY